MDLFRAAYEGSLDTVKSFIEADRNAIHSKDKEDERTALHWAISGGHVHVVRYLIDHDPAANVNALDDANYSPLHIAASVKSEEIVELLLTHGADPNTKNETGHSALHYAASKGQTEICSLLLNHGAEVNATNNQLQTPLHRAAVHGYTIVDRLLRAGARVNPKDKQGDTPLHMACEAGHGDTALLLVEKGGQIDQPNKEEKTPLDLCEKSVRQFLVKQLDLEDDTNVMSS